ncbi:hypothetical protein [Trichloromonas sp.]|uniref:hypothetical protein n=1 Tax=Trichloromonas sp. TaxID=3069249 RepID=UPI003D81ADC1
MSKRSLCFRLLVAGLLACSLTLAGCSGDDGRNGIAGVSGIDGVDGVDGVDGADFQLPQGQVVGLVNCSTCHAASTAVADWLTSAHANQGSHTINTCAAACHNPNGERFEMAAAYGVSPAGYVVGCEACHGAASGHVGVGPIPYAAPGTAQCAQCHGTLPEGHIVYHPFADDIATRFDTSRHAVQNARAGSCSACHSHEGGIELLAMGRMTSDAALKAAYTDASAESYMLPVGSETIVGVMKKTCATCHDPHTTELRGDGDVIVTGLLGGGGATVEQTRTVYSAEFNLCTACHMVDLTATWVPEATETSPNKGMYEYELSSKYTAANLVDAGTGTFDLSKAPFYHDGASGNGRTFVDTHFGGTIMEHLVAFNGSAANITIKGYNVNPGGKNACTICHDPHTAGKMLSIDSSSTVDYADQFDNQAISYAEGLGDFHSNYLGTVSYRNTGCTPCHSGDGAFAALAAGQTDLGDPGWNVLGCRGCHDLAQANAAPGANNSAAFAEVREFPADYEFKFSAPAAAVVTAAELGVNQVCFECHKGRTAGVDVAALADPAAGTTNYSISYLHYAPSMAILYGNDSKMVATYAGKTYAGRFAHYDGAKFGCVDCHNVHDTEGNHAADNKMTTSSACMGCHGPGTFADADLLQARTQAFSERLLATIMTAMVAADGQAGLNATCQAKITALMGAYPNATFATAEEELMDYIQQRVTTFPNKTIAHAASSWKVFTYEDGAPHGQTHGHGGSWAHNSKFARQIMYDAIQSLGGSLTGLIRP